MQIMKNKIFLSLFIIIIAIVIGFIFINKSLSTNTTPAQKKQMTKMEQQVKSYLTGQKGYSEKDIKLLKAEYNPKFKGQTMEFDVRVIFFDEPKVEYTYGVSDNKVFQADTSDPKGKHLEKNSK